MAFKQPPAASGWPPWTLLASEPAIESTLKHCQTTDKVCCSYNPFVSACMAVGQFPHNFSLNSRTQIEEKKGERAQDSQVNDATVAELRIMATESKSKHTVTQ